jgi:hypothetical protein
MEALRPQIIGKCATAMVHVGTLFISQHSAIRLTIPTADDCHQRLEKR